LFIFKIIMALLLFSVIIFVHELGHFLVAKACGIQVNEFAMGMGPKVVSWGKKETTYSIRLFPFGGFCAMEGEDEDSENPRAFNNKKVWQRILVVIAGVTMNFVLAYVVLLFALGFSTPPTASGDVLFGTTTIAQLSEEASSYQTGLRAGDTVVGINGRAVVSTQDMFMFMQSDEDGILDMTVRRDGKKVQLPEVRFELSETEDGTRFLRYDFVLLGVRPTFFNTFVEAAKTEWSHATTVWWSLIDILSGKYGLNEIAGPVGTVDIIGDMVEQAATSAVKENIYSLLMMFSLICVNVGVMNLLPLPALDGGRLIFLLFEAIFRKPVPQKFEGMVHFVGLALLLLLMLLVTFNDVFRLFQGGAIG